MFLRNDISETESYIFHALNNHTGYDYNQKILRETVSTSYHIPSGIIAQYYTFHLNLAHYNSVASAAENFRIEILEAIFDLSDLTVGDQVLFLDRAD